MPHKHRNKHSFVRYDTICCDPFDMYEKWDMGCNVLTIDDELEIEKFDIIYTNLYKKSIYNKCNNEGCIISIDEITEIITPTLHIIPPELFKTTIISRCETVGISPERILMPLPHKKRVLFCEEFCTKHVLCSYCFDIDTYEWEWKHTYMQTCHRELCLVQKGWKIHNIDLTTKVVNFDAINLLKSIECITNSKKISNTIYTAAIKIRRKLLYCIRNALPSYYLPLTIYIKQDTIDSYCVHHNKILQIKQHVKSELDEYLKYHDEAMRDYYMATFGIPCNPKLL